MNAHAFKDQVAIVTGAGEGIGLEIARRLALQGASVLLNDINGELASQAGQDISSEGGTCLGVGGDVGDVQVVRDLVCRAVTEFGRITIAVANAGLSLWDDFFDFKPEDFQRVLAVNLGGSFFLAQAAAREMRKQGSVGRILFMSSVAGNQAIATSSVYAMTKKGLEMLARSLVSEVSSYGITVNAIAPGATVTPRTVTTVPDYEPIWSKVIPTGRPAYPSDLANAALFLLSPAASHITGQTLIVDGGWSALSPEPKSQFVDQTK
ncbi:MAG: SDR family oxidoreductase [bacterium]|nr:SDR family oxidoreductase [bacterium]